MDITVRSVGPDFERLIRDTERDLRRANRTVGRRVATAGRQAIANGAPRMFGRKLSVKTTVKPRADGAEVGFAGRPSGGWAIRESGATPHLIRPRRRKALAFDGRFAERVDHPGTGGSRAWTAAGERLKDAVRPVIIDVYEDAFG